MATNTVESGGRTNVGGWRTLLILVLLGASCGSPSATVTEGAPVGDSVFPADDLVTCRGRPLTLSSLDRIEPLSDRPEIADAIASFLESGEGAFGPKDDLQVIPVSESSALAVVLQTEAQVREQLEQVEGVTVDEGFGDGVDDDRITLSIQAVELRDGAWTWAGSSTGEDCVLETPPPQGVNRVEWEIDVDAAPLTPESTSVQLLATEVECVSGEAMGDRFNEPVVIETDAQVLITLTATRPDGDSFDCPGNPYENVTIDLASPLGDRELRDGSQTAGRLSDYIGPVFGIGTE